MTIDLDMGDGTPKHLVVRAFAKPRPDAVLRWDPDPTDNDWSTTVFPYLVHLEPYAEDDGVVKFAGVDLRTAEDIEGEAHKLSVRVRPRLLRTLLPSTLRGWTPATPYALLFLSKDYPRLGELHAARGKGEYPGKVPAPHAKLIAEMKRFHGRMDGEAKVAFQRAFAQYLDRD